MRKIYLILLIISLLLLTSGLARGHVPLDTGENDSLEKAMHIHDPEKSWAIYDDLNSSAQSKYFKLDLEEGDRFYVSILTPDEGEFSPGLIITGPGIYMNDTVPAHVEVPQGVGILLIEGEKEDEAEYEPFTPASNYPLAYYDEDVNATGEYHIVVFDNFSGGKFVLAIGYQESFTIIEWLSVPVDLIGIYLWMGHSPFLIMVPFLFWIIAVFFTLLIRIKPGSLNAWLVAMGGSLYLGTSMLLTAEMLIALARAPVTPAVAVTLIFIFLPTALGISILFKIIKKKDKIDRKDRILLAIFGVLGLAFWCGVIIGPAIILTASALPLFYIKRKEEVEPKEHETENDQ
jgi:uncharacterized protein YhhL (DUF1145 family)